MRFLADENMARAIVAWIRSAGHDVLYAAELKPGEADDVWLSQAQADNRLIVTADKDFGELVFRDHLNSAGVLLLRMEDLTVQQRLTRLQSVWSVVEANPTGKFIVVTDRKVRVRTMPVPPGK